MKEKVLRQLLIFLTAVLILQFVLKIAQVFILASGDYKYDARALCIVSDEDIANLWKAREADPENVLKPRIIDYSDLNAMECIVQGSVERIDDLALANNLSALVGIFFIFRFFTTLKGRYQRLLDKEPLIPDRHLFIYFFLVLFFVALYLLQVRSKCGDIHGTFFMTGDIPSIYFIQFIEGLFSGIGIVVIAYVPLLFAFRSAAFARKYLARHPRTATEIAPISRLLNTAFVPISISVLWLGVILSEKAGTLFKTHAGENVQTFFMDGATAAVLIVLWFSPYICLLIYMISTLPAGYTIGIGKMGKVFTLIVKPESE